MKPFVLKQHDKDFASVRDLREEEMISISGGTNRPIKKLSTVTVTPNGDGGDDGADEG